jgi:hypothetical protein
MKQGTFLKVEATLNSESRKDQRGNLRASLLGYAAIAILSPIVLNSIYKFAHADLHIPFVYSGDAVFYEALIKNFIGGHYYVNPHLGAPSVQLLYDFPLPHSTHFLVLAILRVFTSSYGLMDNVYYLLTFILEAATAFYAFRRFKCSAPLSVTGSILFAFLPFHLIRSQGHLIHSSYYLVPLAVMVMLWVCDGHPLFGFENDREISWRSLVTRDGAKALVICVLIGGDNPYSAFFSGVFLVIAGLLGTKRRGQRALWSAGILAAVVFISFALNLSPTLLYAHTHGLNPVNHRSTAEAEVYGLKITQLVLPVDGHRVQALARWKASYDAQAPLINENRTATLGVIGTVGFFVLLAVPFLRRVGLTLTSLSVLNVSAVLLGTIGGLGALFSFAVWSQFRGYNRISVFIAFFSLFAAVRIGDKLLRRVRAPHAWLLSLTLAVALLAIGLPDEIPRHIAGSRSALEATFRSDDEFVHMVESALPAGSMIFQLPYTALFQPSPANTDLYDELKPYLHSRTLRWSAGAMTNRNTDQWLRNVTSKSTDQLIEEVRNAGFAGICIDRFGFADRGVAIEAQLSTLLGLAPMVSRDGRRLFYPLDRNGLQRSGRTSGASPVQK